MYPAEIFDKKEGMAATSFSLQQIILKLAFFNLFLVASLGLLLRSFSFNDIPLNYKFLLHAHSHFAFGGWIMPLLIWLILRYFPEYSARVGSVHWRNITGIIFFSAYGMLSSFPFQGYGVISIIFSTLSIISGFYLAF